MAAAGRTFLNIEKSITGRRWVERLTPEASAAALAIAQRQQLPDIMARVMAARGVRPDDAEAFLTPTVKGLMPDPSVLTGMDAAAERIADAIAAGEKIAIFGDYDVDGASSSALMARFLRHQGLDPSI
jgi:single-stranded-DNA-specific exonuclease